MAPVFVTNINKQPVFLPDVKMPGAQALATQYSIFNEILQQMEGHHLGFLSIDGVTDSKVKKKKRGQSLPCTPPVAKKARPEVLADDHVRPPSGGRVRKKKKCDNEVVGGPARAPSRKSSRNAAPPRKLVPEGAGSKSVEAPVARSFTSAREPEAQAADP